MEKEHRTEMDDMKENRFLHKAEFYWVWIKTSKKKFIKTVEKFCVIRSCLWAPESFAEGFLMLATRPISNEETESDWSQRQQLTWAKSFKMFNFTQVEIGHRLSVSQKIVVKINKNTNLNRKGTLNRDGWHERKSISSQRGARILLSLNVN